MPLFGPPNIDKMEEKKDVKGLVKALGYEKDRPVRRNAAEALGHIGDPRAVEPLIGALKDDDRLLREAAAEALGRIADARAARPLALLLDDAFVRRSAVTALGRIGGSSVADAVLDVVRDKRNLVRGEAVQVLYAVGDVATDQLIHALKEQRPEVRACAAEALGRIGAKRAVQDLLGLLRDEYVRGTAVDALGRIGDKRAVCNLIDLLRNDDDSLRATAARALTSLAWEPEDADDRAWYAVARHEWKEAAALGPSATEPLIATLNVPSKDIRKAGVEALAEIGDPRAVEPLIAAVNDRDFDVRRAAVKGLGRFDDPRATESLIAALEDEDSYVCDASAEALGQMGATVVEPLLAMLGGMTRLARRRTAELLGQIGDPRAVEPLIARLNDEELDIREAAARALGNIGDSRAVDPLIAAIGDGDSDVRRVVAGALGSIGDPRAVEPLVATLEGDKDSWVRVSAGRALAAMYGAGELGEQARQRILAVRPIIEDTRHHQDLENDKGCYHMDEVTGVDFPL